MPKSRDISARYWNLPQKPREEAGREGNFIDDIIQKAHIWREILSCLDGVGTVCDGTVFDGTVFDGGAGTGRFSIPLAKRGLRVTHFDISEAMLAQARETAEREGVLDRMTFVHGALEDLDAYADRQFDMVLSFDAPVSYTYPNQEAVLQNLARICGKRLILSVYSRLGWIYHFNPAQKVQYILDKNSGDPLARWSLDRGLALLSEHKPDMRAVWALYRSGLMEPVEATAAAYEAGGAPWPVSYAFMPEELTDILTRCGAKDIRLAGPGALSRSIPNEVLCNIMGDEKLKEEFLDFCFTYDSHPNCAGMGKDNLVASAAMG